MTERQPTEERQRQIAAAALKIIAQQGLGKFTTLAIAKEVGISDGTIFRHFKNKEEIVLAAITLVEEALFENFPPDREDPVERLGAFVQGRLQLLNENPQIVKLLFSEQLAQASGARGLKKVRDMQSKSLNFIRDCLEEARRKKLLDKRASTDELTIVVFGTIVGTVYSNFYQKMFPARAGGKNTAGLWATLEHFIRG